MRRLLLLQMALLCLVSAIPKEDLSLLKQVEIMSERTYNLIMESKLEFNTYTAKLVCDCRAASGTELDRWQHWLELSHAGRVNTTEKVIKKYVDILGRSRAKPTYDPYIPSTELQQNLNKCTKNAFEAEQSKYLKSKYNILRSFKNEASPVIQEVSNATKQSDKFLFTSFDFFVKHGNETVFMFIRSKIPKYEDRALLMEVKSLVEGTNLQMERVYMKNQIYKMETIISCNIINQSELEKLKTVLDLFKKTHENITHNEFLEMSLKVAAFLPPFELSDEFLDNLNKCFPGFEAKLNAKTDLECNEKIDDLLKNASPKMQQVSEFTKQLEHRIFEAFGNIANPNLPFEVRHQKFTFLSILLEFY